MIKSGTTAGKRAAFRCLMSDVPITYDYIREQGKAGHMGVRLMAIVVEGDRGRIYLTPISEMEEVALKAKPDWWPAATLPVNPRDFKTPNYGLTTFGDLFTPRQLVALTTFSDLVQEARARVIEDAKAAGMVDDGVGIDAGGSGAAAYAEAVSIYLAIALSRLTDICNALCRWEVTKTQVRNLFGRQAIPMLWDFAENNVFGNAAGDYFVSLSNMVKALEQMPAASAGNTRQDDAQNQSITAGKLVSTDPPYYDNIGYADLSDFFYVWLRRSLKSVFSNLFATLAVPKAEELVATPYRHGSKERAEAFFLDGMTQAIHKLAEQAHPAFPVTIYYAFKQSETESAEGTASTGWETFLDAVIRSGFAINGTWPMRTELGNRMIGSGTNALASSIVLVCRKRIPSASTISRREFQRELREQMPEALETMIGGAIGVSPIAPVDLAQAAIGPGMAIFSKHAAVLEADGTQMSVHNALILINKEIDAFLNPEGSGFDNDTLFCSAWFEQYGWNNSKFGEADTLSRAKGTSVVGLKAAGVVDSGGGKVRLLQWEEYPDNWNPTKDERTPIWEAAHHMIRMLNLTMSHYPTA